MQPARGHDQTVLPVRSCPLQLDAIFNEETDVADANCLLDCVIRSEYAWDRDTPDKWWTDAFNTRRKAGGLLDP